MCHPFLTIDYAYWTTDVHFFLQFYKVQNLVSVTYMKSHYMQVVRLSRLDFVQFDGPLGTDKTLFALHFSFV